MRTALALLLTGLLATAAIAGDNPDVRAYIDFSPPNYEHCYTPVPYTIIDAYFVLDNIPGGVTAVAFLLSDSYVECPNAVATQTFVNFLPGNLMIGDPFFPPGATIASTECMYDDPLIVGAASYFYLIGDCCINVLYHLDYPGWVVDCNDPGLVDYYCVLAHGEINSLGCPGDLCPPGDCDITPVETESWSQIKAMYR
jgi:hypothetical protein